MLRVLSYGGVPTPFSPEEQRETTGRDDPIRSDRWCFFLKKCVSDFYNTSAPDHHPPVPRHLSATIVRRCDVTRFAEVVQKDCSRVPITVVSGTARRPAFRRVRRPNSGATSKPVGLFFFEALVPDNRRLAWRLAALCTMDTLASTLVVAQRTFCTTARHRVVHGRGHEVEIDLRGREPTLAVKKRVDILREGVGHEPTTLEHQLWLHLTVTTMWPVLVAHHDCLPVLSPALLCFFPAEAKFQRQQEKNSKREELPMDSSAATQFAEMDR